MSLGSRVPNKKARRPWNRRAKYKVPLWLSQYFRALFLILSRRDLIGLVFGEQCLELRLLGRRNRQRRRFNWLQAQTFSRGSCVNLVRRTLHAGFGLLRAGIAEPGGTVSDAGAGAETAGAVVPGAGAAGCDSTCGTGRAAGAAFESDVVGVTAGGVAAAADFVVQAQPAMRSPGQPNWLRERRPARELLPPVKSPPGPAGLNSSPFPPPFDPAPRRRRLEPECRPRGRE